MSKKTDKALAEAARDAKNKKGKARRKKKQRSKS